jgi:ketosteroid isomerase-like protein
VSQENLDLVRSIFVDYERGEFGRVDFADRAMELVVVDGPNPGTFTGLASTAGGLRGVADSWEDLRVEADSYRELDDARVLAFTRATGRGKMSGLQTSAKGVMLVHVRDGKVVRLLVYWDRDRALTDLGLEE